MKRRMDELTLALLRSASIDPDDVVSVFYAHDVGGIPKLTVTHLVCDHKAGAFSTTTVTYVPEEAQ